jgi:hypothetical protein
MQRWSGSAWQLITHDAQRNPIGSARCDHCQRYSIWIGDVMVHPDTGNAPPANADLPASVISIYNEAASISSKSPRGAAALLRLAVQIFCKELGGGGENINQDIGDLVKSKGLPPRVQQALDIAGDG